MPTPAAEAASSDDAGRRQDEPSAYARRPNLMRERSRQPGSSSRDDRPHMPPVGADRRPYARLEPNRPQPPRVPSRATDTASPSPTGRGHAGPRTTRSGRRVAGETRGKGEIAEEEKNIQPSTTAHTWASSRVGVKTARPSRTPRFAAASEDRRSLRQPAIPCGRVRRRRHQQRRIRTNGYPEATRSTAYCRPPNHLHAYDGEMEWVSEAKMAPRATFDVVLPQEESERRLRHRASMRTEMEWGERQGRRRREGRVQVRADGPPDAVRARRRSPTRTHAGRDSPRGMGVDLGERPEIVTSDEPDLERRIASCGGGTRRWLVSV